ncbi:MAG: hypothetical protein BroJett011_42560 [Chloroflexota bacterium]|nr:MAG: hypothetical protein BroJett011_42560 [Chloroflexota bacterium]
MILLLAGCRQAHAYYISGPIIVYPSALLMSEVGAYLYSYRLCYLPTEGVVRVSLWMMEEVTPQYLGWTEQHRWQTVALPDEPGLEPAR